VSRSVGSGQDRVYEALRTRIIEHELEPGARISISGEAQRLGVSPTPVREALNRLEGDDLVVRIAARGYAVTPLIDLAGLAELFELRLLLEPWAAREAATTRLHNPAPILRHEVEIFAGLHGMDRTVLAQRALCDQRFHRSLIDAAGNSFLTTAMHRLHTHVHVFRLHQVDLEGRETQREHIAVAEAVEACDPDAAEEAMRVHLHGAFARLREGFGADAAGNDGAAAGDSSSSATPPVVLREARSRLR